MSDELKKDSMAVDRGLIAMCRKMTPEERLRANDHAVRTILELREAFKKKKNDTLRSKPTT